MTIPLDETARQRVLDRYRITESLPDPAFDDIVRVAAIVCGVQRALITVIDRDRQWFKAAVGLSGDGTPRDQAFCDHAIREPDRMMEVSDARTDPRFADNPSVTGDPHVRFYAGMPLVTTGGAAIGALCVIDTETRALDDRQRVALNSLARLAMALFEARHREHEAARAKLADTSHGNAAVGQAETNYMVAIIELQDATAVMKRIGERTLEARFAELQHALEARLPKGDSVSRVSGCAELILLLHDSVNVDSVMPAMREAMAAFEHRTQSLLLNVQATSQTPSERIERVFERADLARSREIDRLSGRAESSRSASG